MNALRIHTRTLATGPVLEMVGELDHRSAPQLRNSIASLRLQPGQLLILDLSALVFFDSSGISAFVVARRTAVAARAGIALAGVPERIERVLRICGLDKIFPIHRDARSATAAWTSLADSP